MSYARKTDREIDYPATRREPGGLERAVLMLVIDGYDYSSKIARVLETSIDNVNGALARLHYSGTVSRTSYLPVQWFATETGKKRCQDEDLWQ